jgi:hypothetical protein
MWRFSPIPMQAMSTPFIDGFFYRRRGIPGGRFAHGIAGRVDL